MICSDTHREEEILKQHEDVSSSLQMKINSLEQEKENVQSVTRYNSGVLLNKKNLNNCMLWYLSICKLC